MNVVYTGDFGSRDLEIKRGEKKSKTKKSIRKSEIFYYNRMILALSQKQLVFL